MNGQRSVVCTCIGACAYFELQFYYYRDYLESMFSYDTNPIKYILTILFNGLTYGWCDGVTICTCAAVDLERTGTSF